MIYLLIVIIIVQFLIIRNFHLSRRDVARQRDWYQGQSYNTDNFWREEYDKIEEQWRQLLPPSRGGKSIQQTRIYGSTETERLVCEWLEEQHGPFGDDLTDFENTVQIAARIRRGEYLKGQIDENVSVE